jgi:hypothetical protein
MRSVLIAIFVLAFSFSYAQQIKIGLRGGMNLNNVPTKVKKGTIDSNYPSNFDFDTKGAAKPTYGLLLAFALKRFELGIGADFGSIKYEYAQKFSGTTISGTNTVNESQFFAPHVFLNYKISLLRSYAYAGISAGGFFHPKEKVAASFYLANGSYTSSTEYKKPTDIFAGAQVGYCLTLIGGFSINVEAAMRYVNLSSTVVTYNLLAQPIISGNQSAFFYFPITLGISHKI